MTNLNPLESKIEADAVRRARRSGWIAIKIGGAGINKRGWPDRLFLWNGIYVWIEFKRIGNTLSENQKRRRDELIAQQAHYFVCWTVEEAIALLNGYQGRNWYPGCEDL